MKGLRVLVEGFEVLHKTVAGFKVRYWFQGYRFQVWLVGKNKAEKLAARVAWKGYRAGSWQ